MLQSHAELRDPILHFAHGKLQIVPYHRTPAGNQTSRKSKRPRMLNMQYVCLTGTYILYMYSNVFTSLIRSKYCPSRSFECHSLCIFLQVSPFHAAVSLATGVYLTLHVSAGIKLEDNPIAEHILLNKGVRVSKCKCCRAFNAPLH